MEDLKEIIKQTHAQWRETKDIVEGDCRERGLDNLAAAYHGCKMFRGDESVEELARLFKTPEAVDFCIKNHFPTLRTLRQFKQCQPEKYGIYIDAGNIRIKNPEKVILIGYTNATITCDELKRHQIILMHGARANITASGWAVVALKAEAGCIYMKTVTDHAIIL